MQHGLFNQGFSCYCLAREMLLSSNMPSSQEQLNGRKKVTVSQEHGFLQKMCQHTNRRLIEAYLQESMPVTVSSDT